MATQSLRILWTEEPGRLQSMWSQRAGLDRVSDTHTNPMGYLESRSLKVPRLLKNIYLLWHGGSSSLTRDRTWALCIGNDESQLLSQGSPRILEWVVCPFSRTSSQPRNQTGVSCIVGGFFTN